MPLSCHYVGIASGGALIAMAAHVLHPSSTLSIIKKREGLFGKIPSEEWVLIDDVVTTGGSLRKAIELIGSQPKKIIVAHDWRVRNEDPVVYSIFEP